MLKNYKIFLNRFLKLAIIIKGIDGILDVLTSIILFFYGSSFLVKIIPFLLRKELIEDPQDLVANYLFNSTQHILPNTKLFIIIYLAIHGLIKIGLALAIRSHNIKAYKITAIILAIFICYQFYRFSHTHSSFLLLVTLFDMTILYLIYNERKNIT